MSMHNTIGASKICMEESVVQSLLVIKEHSALSPEHRSIVHAYEDRKCRLAQKQSMLHLLHQSARADCVHIR